MTRDIRTLDGRLFTLVRKEPYTREDGTSTTLDVWESLCQVCAGPFEVSTPSAGAHDSKAFGSKHCADHKLTRGEVSARWQGAISESRAAKRGAK